MKPRVHVALLLAVLSSVFVTACVTTRSDGRQVSNKDAATANVELGVAYMQQGQFQAAKDKLERAEKQDPDNYKVHWAMASLSEQLNQPAEAERYYKAALRLSPDNVDVTNTYAVFLCKAKKVDQALPLFDAVIRNRLYRTPWAAAANAGVCLRADKRNADAEMYLQRSLALLPTFTTAVIELSDLQVSLGKPAAAVTTVDNFLGLGRKSPDVLVVGVRAALAKGDRSAAENYARLLRRDFPGSPQAALLPQLLDGAK
jgi:type IV pilus assembly protein PilF